MLAALADFAPLCLAGGHARVRLLGAPPRLSGPQADSVDIAYPPLVQSGGDYDLRLAAGTSKDTHIHYGVIVCHLGARWAGPPGIACKLPRVPRCSVVRAAVPPA